MTPAEEKAIELVDKFYNTTPNEAWFNPPLASASMEYKAWAQAKQCALIAVDEIKKADLHHPFDQMYWDEVKQEIENL